MKKYFIICVLLISINHIQENDGWLLNFDKAAEQSMKTGKPILANFTGSDWCS